MLSVYQTDPTVDATIAAKGTNIVSGVEVYTQDAEFELDE
jgi:hypothetical protein